MPLFSQASPLWSAPNGSSELWTKIIIALLVALVILGVLLKTPLRLRGTIVSAVTFLAGLYYVLLWAWPKAIDRQEGQLARNGIESVGFWLEDANGVFTDATQVLTSFMVGLGIASLLRVHVGRLYNRKEGAGFSLVLLLSMIAMIIVGYGDFMVKQQPAGSAAIDFDNPANWTMWNRARDFLFNGLLQQMDAAMFSLIAFYIVSAAYRAFRIRSIEATILLGTALLMILSLMGAVSFLIDKQLLRPFSESGGFLGNFQLGVVASWVKSTFQTAALQGIAFGVGIGALAMGLRLWLSLERSGGN